MSLTPDTFDRDRPFTWNVMGALFPESKYGIGNSWEHFAEDDGSLVCEQCSSSNAMIVNDPFDPEESVDFDTPVQVLCTDCAHASLPEDSSYR